MSPKDKLDEIKKAMFRDLGEGLIYSPEYSKDKMWLVAQLEKAWERESKLIEELGFTCVCETSMGCRPCKVIRNHAKEVENG